MPYLLSATHVMTVEENHIRGSYYTLTCLILLPFNPHKYYMPTPSADIFLGVAILPLMGVFSDQTHANEAKRKLCADGEY